MSAVIDRQRYDSQWHDWEKRSPGNWREFYHGKPNVGLASLCRLAERLRARVELTVSDGTVGEKSQERRNLRALQIVVPGERTLLVVAIHAGESIGDAADRCRTVLERKL